MKQGPRDADLPKDTAAVPRWNPNPGALLLFPEGRSPLSWLHDLSPPGVCLNENMQKPNYVYNVRLSGEVKTTYQNKHPFMLFTFPLYTVCFLDNEKSKKVFMHSLNILLPRLSIFITGIREPKTVHFPFSCTLWKF